MTTRSFTEVSDRFGEVYDAVVDRNEPVRVDREGEPGVVILPADEYDSLAETAHLLSSPANAARLLAALASARQGTTKPMTLEELREAVGL